MHFSDLMGHSSSAPNHEDVAMVGLDAMQRANSTLEDFVSFNFSLIVKYV